MPTVLVADEGRFVDGTVEFLEWAGFTCWAVSTSEDALEILTQRQPDLALLEVHLSWPYSKTEGLAILQRAKRIVPRTKVCVMCLYDYREEAEALGADAFVPKCQPQELLGILKGLLDDPSALSFACQPS